MKVGASGTAACSTNGGFALDYTYKSSDPKIVSVDKNGNLNAWKKELLRSRSVHRRSM